MQMISKNISPGALGDIVYDGLKEDHDIFWDIRFWVDNMVWREMWPFVTTLMLEVEGESDTPSR